MAESSRQQAFALFSLGKRPGSDEVKALKIKLKTRLNYFQIWKKLFPDLNAQYWGIDGDGVEGIPQETEITTLQDTSLNTPKDTPPATPPKPKSAPLGTPGGAPIAVGRITITPENWGMTQEGAILIIDTFNKAKRDIGYTGTMGGFICDVFVFYRRVMNYEEVYYVGTGETSGGGGGNPKDGSEGNGTKHPVIG